MSEYLGFFCWGAKFHDIFDEKLKNVSQKKDRGRTNKRASEQTTIFVLTMTSFFLGKRRKVENWNFIWKNRGRPWLGRFIVFLKKVAPTFDSDSHRKQKQRKKLQLKSFSFFQRFLAEKEKISEASAIEIFLLICRFAMNCRVLTIRRDRCDLGLVPRKES